jgi:hypothetical protein
MTGVYPLRKAADPTRSHVGESNEKEHLHLAEKSLVNKLRSEAEYQAL